MAMMKAAVFVEPGRIVLDDKRIPDVGPQDALIRVTTTTICGTDIHILKGEYPVERGLTIGHEPVGVIEKLGSGVRGYREGQRVIAGAITPSGWSTACLCGVRFAGRRRHASMAGRRWAAGSFGNTIDGCQAEYVLVPDAMANLAAGARQRSTDEQVLMCPDIMSTGFSGAESAGVQHRRHGGRVRAGAHRPVRHGRGQAQRRFAVVIGVDRLVQPPCTVATKMGADHVIDASKLDPVEEIMRLTDGRGVDVAIEALGTQQTFEACLAGAATGRHAVQPWRLFGRPDHPGRRRLPRAWATTGSSRRCAPAARSACAG